MKNICIIYNAGAYGTFINWVLTDFLKSPSERPFLDNGSAHQFRGNHLNTHTAGIRPKVLEELTDYVNSDKDYKVIRVHPKASIQDNNNLNDLLDYVNKNFKKAILLHPTYDSIIWNINNSQYKIHPDEIIRESAELKSNLINWGVTNDAEAELWQLREFMSYYKYPQFLSESEIDLIPQLKDKFTNIHFLPIDSLRINFNKTIADLLRYCELPEIDNNIIDTLGKDWAAKQWHMNKDPLIKKIITSTINNEYHDWSQVDLTTIDEAMIQYYLREYNIEIKCYNLNQFPTNTNELRTYLDYTT